jgi:membrane-bound serine protease (ClpP class)
MKKICLIARNVLCHEAISALKDCFATLFFSMTLALVLFTSNVFASSIPIVTLKDDTINPVTADYIIKAIDLAETTQAPCVIIKLDTPGGLLNSTRSIVKRMLISKVPIVVYISPSGAHAGSAGVFITYASHIAAMAPSTNIGAAHPIQYGGGNKKETKDWDELKDMIEQLKKNQEPKNKKNEDTKKNDNDKTTEMKPDENALESKLLNDTVAFIKTIAEKRGRNVEWAVQSVVKSDSITEDEAVTKKVVELIAKDDMDLIKQLNGRSVQVDGQNIILKTDDAQPTYITMNKRQRLFNILANPDIAYMLLILGFYGLLYEITHPGVVMPGVLGAIFMILAFYSMQTLPVNYAGLALVFIGLGLLVGEIFTPGIGALAVGGIISLIIGSLLLFESVDPVMRVSIDVVISFAVIAGILSFILLRLVWRSKKSKILTGKEGILHETGEAANHFHKDGTGKVNIHGELWNAESDEAIAKGDKVRVLKVQGLTLTVKKK